MSLEFEKQTYLLRRCFFEVHNEVGKGWQEEAYHQACVLWFRQQKLPVVSKRPHKLSLRGEDAHCIFPDFVGWNAISVELKAVPRSLHRAEFVQLFDYLKCRGDRLGFLVNMGMDRVEIERIIYDPPETAWVENWDSRTNRISGLDRATGLGICEALRVVYQEHTTGYGQEIVTKLVQHALRQQRLTTVVNPVAKSYFRGVEIHESPLACSVVDERILLMLSALADANGININRGKSYLKALNLQWGVAADFGRRRAEVIGFRCDP